MSMNVANAGISKKSAGGTKYRNPALEEAIHSLGSDTYFEFTSEQLTELDMPILIDQALNTKQIETLIISANEINAKGIQLLAEALCHNVTLVKLDLDHNPVGSGLTSLTEALHTNKTLTSLSLVSTDIDDAGARSLGEMLQNNEALVHLNLSDNQISSKGVQYLTEALHGSSNSTLEELFLGGNPIDDDCINDLIQMLKYNKVLQRVTIESSDISEEEKDKLQKAVSRKNNFSFSFIKQGIADEDQQKENDSDEE